MCIEGDEMEYVRMLEDWKVREFATRAASVDIGVHGVLVGHGWVYGDCKFISGKAKAKGEQAYITGDRGEER